ncbi:hypothetical protein G114_02164 [Aeromonas diversa CDC 2478-85]|uniref:SCP2 domain-containing protein n=1 Tax=Aeromonas diversa CDC 2478-85 TaxID=1268237 RepID=N9U551_9GAMM|nr:SCP2 sterol-binding domain-containing protein [Aeromonas diversa]ENY73530.1 hypothetical protein G114_02164 [Aeromonas diversa CDC 2478-85]
MSKALTLPLSTLAWQGKRTLITLLMWGMGRTLSRAARVDPVVARELAPLPDGFCFQLKVRGLGCHLTLQKQGAIWRASRAAPTLCMTFKHPQTALRVLGFRLGINQSFCEGRVSVEGDLTAAMHLVRALEALESLLLPAFLARPLLRQYRAPERKLPRALNICAGLLIA